MRSTTISNKELVQLACRPGAAWESKFAGYRETYPDLADEIERMQRRDLPDRWQEALPFFPPDPKGIASRDSSGQVLNDLAQSIPWLLGGSADLSPSTKTNLTFEGAGDFQADSADGRNLHFGIREHVSAAIANGLALTKLRPYWSGFLIFSDYARGAIRLSALMEIPVVHIFTHDSIGVGEDGPTHQPVEQLASLRAVPGLLGVSSRRRKRSGRDLAFRRGLAPRACRDRPFTPSAAHPRPVGRGAASGLSKGAYTLIDAVGASPDAILMATGSEIQLALAARDELLSEGIDARVVSMPCWELFDRQPSDYRDQVLPPSVKARVAIEQASTLGWDRYVGDGGAVVGMHTFGASAPLEAAVDEVRVHSRQGGRGDAALCRGAKGVKVKATESLHEQGQSLWLDNITRNMLDSGQIQRFI